MVESEVEAPLHQHRRRLLEGMAHAVAAKGYADTTIADIVREASVSRRTFYEQFPTKAECLIALYEAASHNALKVLREAFDPSLAWEARVEKALDAYFACMAQNPVLMRTLFIEILGLGPEGLEARRRRVSEIAQFILQVVNVPGREKALSASLAMAVVGAINELVLEYIEQDRVRDLRELVAPASEIVRAVIGPK
ncbi:MAG: TetR/AcrR family transcriptional regulator [Burkholderiales bacterium]|nr:TetR/AcrR family transcriptional regulator [Burkholderiales bacterium]